MRQQNSTYNKIHRRRSRRAHNCASRRCSDAQQSHGSDQWRARARRGATVPRDCAQWHRTGARQCTRRRSFVAARRDAAGAADHSRRKSRRRLQPAPHTVVPASRSRGTTAHSGVTVHSGAASAAGRSGRTTAHRDAAGTADRSRQQAECTVQNLANFFTSSFLGMIC